MVKKWFNVGDMLAVVASLCLFGHVYGLAEREIRGCIKIDGLMDKVPQVRILFDGKEVISNGEGFFSFPLDEGHIVQYSLLITEAVQQKFDKANTLKGLTVASGQRYRYFVFKKEGWGLGWEQYEKTIKYDSFLVPEHCVIVLLDPEYVARVERWNVFLPESMIKLPVIVLKNTVAQEKIKRASAQSLLASLDTTPFHEAVPEVVKVPGANEKKSVVSLFQ